MTFATVAMLLAVPVSAHAVTVQAPTTVTPGHDVTFTVSGLAAGDLVDGMLIEPAAAAGGKAGDHVRIPQIWHADLTGQAHLTFTFPTTYLRCSGPIDCKAVAWDDPIAVITVAGESVRVPVAGLAPAPVATRPRSSRPVTVSTAGQAHVRRPAVLRLSARTTFRDLRWRSWDTKQATGLGTITLVGARGTRASRPVRVILTRVRTCNGRRIYTRVRYRVADGRWTSGQLRNCRLRA